MPTSKKSRQPACFIVLTILAVFFEFGSGVSVNAQTTDNLQKDWYCDQRLDLLPHLRSGTVEQIQTLEKLSQRQLIQKFTKDGVEYETKNVIVVKLANVYTGEEDYNSEKMSHGQYEFLNVRTKNLAARKFKSGETYLFETDTLGLEYFGKGSYQFQLEYIRPNGYLKTLNEASEDIKFFNLTKNRNSAKEILGYEGEILSGGVINGKARNLVTPKYPIEAKKARIAETIYVMVLINEDGDVFKAKAYCYKNQSLAEAAEQAALASKFSPTMISGKPVKVRGVIVYNFVKD